jgi:D-glycero-D-manno-heptose 1,7-bisphosphate phosphatase
MHCAVFLDRDDTININADLPEAAWEGTRPGDLLKPDFVRLLPGAREALQSLKNAGYRLIVITNQSGVAHCGGCLRDIDATNGRLDQLLTVEGQPLVEAFYSAPTHPEGTDPRFAIDHPWRKPGPGMILAAAHEHDLDLSRSWMVGDKDRDTDAATNAGVPKGRALRIGPGQKFADLPEAARYILEHTPRPGAAPVGTTTISMRADDPNLLNELAETVLATARGIAERHGTRLIDLSIENGHLEARLATGRMAALGFMAEVRRTTNDWAQANRGRPIWPDQPDANPDADHD